MSMIYATAHSEIPIREVPIGLQSLCTELSHSGQLYLGKIAVLIDELAPRPGSLLYVQAKKLTIRVNGLEPVIFSAVDATTHLQVAQVYLALTTAAAVSFFDFVAQSFPFRISQIRSRDEKPFHHPTCDQSCRDFTAMMGKKELVHSIIANPSHDVLLSLTSRLMFGGINEGSMVLTSEQDVQRELARFLLFHNNYRPIPWLEGRTPIQKLKSFNGFAGVHLFDPYGLPWAKSAWMV